MLADPAVIKYNTVDKNHVRTRLGDGVGEFSWEDGADNQLVTTKQTSSKGRFRREVRLSRQKDYENPLSGLTVPVGISVYLVIDEPKAGFNNDDVADMVISLSTYLTASSAAKTYQVAAGEY
jgi:hypothetical protein